MMSSSAYLSRIILASALAGTLAYASGNSNVTTDTHMNQIATGPFDVKLNPLEAYNRDEGAHLGRMSIDKQFHGDLDATSKGEMLSTGVPGPKGSGAYVAIERVSGTLHGRRGSFVLAHNATMTLGVPYLNIIVAPGTGTDELVGLAGRMKIDIAPGGKHSYTFEYTLASAAPH